MRQNGRKMQIENDVKLNFKDVLIRPKRSTLTSRRDVTLVRFFEFGKTRTPIYSNTGIITKEFVPIMAANMDSVGTFRVANVLNKYNMITCFTKHTSNDDIKQWYLSTDNINWFYSMGITTEDFDKFKNFIKIIQADLEYLFVNVDIANGYIKTLPEFIRTLRQTKFPLVISAGNVVTREMTEELILAGADIVKIGIGPGSACTTRDKTGVGYPQLSAIIECADAAHGLGGYVIADGGCKTSGDVAKAFGAGADFVMLGGMFTGHTENLSDTIFSQLKDEYDFYLNLPESAHASNNLTFEDFAYSKLQKSKLTYYGMSSKEAMINHYGKKADYRAAEGQSIMVDYKGHLCDTVEDILGGLRSTCTYIGARRLKDIPKCTTFVKVA